MPDITGIHHLSLTVRDADASADFYRNVFGFVKVLDLPDEQGRGFKRILAHGATRTILGLSVHDANEGTPFTEFRTGLDHLSFGVSSPNELEAWAAHLDALGVARSEVRATPIGSLLTVRDPDDIQVELWADLA